MAPATLDALKHARRDLFEQRTDAHWLVMSAVALSFAAVQAVAAQAELHHPWSPVPVTLQTGFVLLSGALLGRRYGPASQLMYGGLGATGALPIFAGGATGRAVLTGVTGGYLAGFVVAAALVGALADRFVGARSFTWLLAVFLVADAVILALGAVWLGMVRDLTAWQALVQGALVFVPGDVAKAVAAAGVATSVLPKAPFGPEDGT